MTAWRPRLATPNADDGPIAAFVPEVFATAAPLVLALVDGAA